MSGNHSESREFRTSHETEIALRKSSMSVLSHCASSEISSRLEEIALPAYEELREAERGLVMVSGRIGGDGAAFNLGEATVSRSAIRLATGEVGFGYVLGRDTEKARLIAICDALAQAEGFAPVLEEKVVLPLLAALNRYRREKAAQAAATRVDFYTMVRGEG